MSVAQLPEQLPGLAGKTVAVTGAASGIGRATALLLGRSGIRIVAGDRDTEQLAKVAAEAAETGFEIETVVLELTDNAGVDAFVAAANSRGDLAGLASVAGIAPEVPALETTRELWDQVVAIDMTAPFFLAQATAKAMIANGAGGSIVTVGSVGGHTGPPGLAAYAAAKAGVVGMSKSLARELGRHGIRVNVVAPGAIDTPLYWAREAHFDDVSKLPMGRRGEPDDVAATISFLLSGMSPWVTGQTVCVNGGSFLW